MTNIGRLSLAASVLALAAVPDGATTRAGDPRVVIPPSAQGNGYRGSGGNKRHESRVTKNKRRKLALASKRRNRR